ncbi:O-antigen ligase family protein [Micromonospora sp. NPDC050397]|uniref:O-antigen ligase family protein n=1 Tax=Micromonospora sp. NPDC050397 TaxID=3364279 RepID=UPI00384ED4E7
MARSVGIVAGGGVLALMLGVLAGWQPVALVALLLAVLLGWGLWTPERLNYTLLAVLFFVPATASLGYPVEPVWVILLAAVLITLYGRLQRYHPSTPLLSSAMAGLLLPAVCLLAALANWSRPQDLVSALVPLVSYGIITWHLVDEARRDPDGVRRLARAVAWFGVPLAILSIYQRVSGTWPVLDQFAIDEGFTASAGPGRSVGTMGHPIVYGTYCMLVICIALTMRGRLWQIPFAAGAIGLLLSGSRSAWIGTACALAIWYLALERKFTRRGVLTALSFVAVGGGLVFFGPKPIQDAVTILRDRLTNLTGSSSATARYRRTGEAWSGVWHDLGTVLSGHGPEAHVRFFQQFSVGDGLAPTFDNTYLTLWYDFGLVALLVLVALMVLPLFRFRSLAARMIILGFAVQIWFFDVYLWPAAAATLILAAGIAVADSAAPKPTTPASPGPHPSHLVLLR